MTQRVIDRRVIERILEVLKDNARSCGACGEGEYRGAVGALNEVEMLLGLPVTRDYEI